MPKTKRYSAVSERMPSPFRQAGTRSREDGNRVNPIYDPTNKRLNPDESFGACKNTFKRVRRGTTKGVAACKNFKVTLGNGYCQDCWDRMGQDTDMDEAKHLNANDN